MRIVLKVAALKTLLVKAKFHYVIWLEAGSKLVADSFEPDSVMEFGRRLADLLARAIVRC